MDHKLMVNGKSVKVSPMRYAEYEVELEEGLIVRFLVDPYALLRNDDCVVREILVRERRNDKSFNLVLKQDSVRTFVDLLEYILHAG